MSYFNVLKSGGGSVVTPSATNGNIKVDNVEVIVYEHPAQHDPSIIATNSENQFVTQAEKNKITDTYTKAETDAKISGLINSAPATLDTLKELADALGDDPNFATTITTQIGQKVDKIAGKGLSTNDFTNEYKAKVDAIGTGGTTVNATDVVTDSTHLFVTQNEKNQWDAKSVVASSTTNGNILINGTETTVYTHPASHTAASITTDSTHRFVTDTQISTWNGKTVVADSATNGNILINGVDTNVYTLPSALSPSIITQDASNRFVTDTEKSTWNGKASTALASGSANGLMSSSDFTKLAGVETNANNYTHPASHAATMITEDSTHRFATDAEKTKWNYDKAFAICLMNPSDNTTSCSFVLPSNCTIKTVKVQLDVAPSASTNLEVYVAGTKITTIAFSTIATSYTANLNANAGDIVYVKILTANSTKALSAVFTVGDR